MYVCGKDYKTLFLLADSALKLFPGDQNLTQKYQELSRLKDVPR